MATAYAAVVSLTQIIDQVQTYHHARQTTFVDEQLTLIKNLKEKVSCMQVFLEKFSHVAESLPSQIANAAHVAEDILETFIVDDIHHRYKKKDDVDDIHHRYKKDDDEEETPIQFENDKDQRINGFCERLSKVITEMVLIAGKMGDIEKNKADNLQPQSRHPASIGSLTSADIDSKVVGFDDYLAKVMGTLDGSQPYLILSITGMGGIGKTTLAKTVYDDSYIRDSFKYRGWITLSQKFNLREALLCLLRDFNATTFDEEKDDDYELGNKLYQHLSNKRFLVVLDDLWTSDAFEKLKFYIKGKNKSRVIVTTRHDNVAKGFSSSFQKIDLLNEKKSWELLCKKSFPGKECPAELMNIGKKIAENCKGLPLSLVVIGGHLANSNKTQETWKHVADQTSRFVNLEDDERCQKTLSLSYTQLPIHLKPCLLYMGVFPEDRIISVKELVQLWVAEGFLKPENDKTLEEVAQNYLIDLIDRNLVFARKFGSIGNLKACQIHDLVRGICLTEGVKERFFCPDDPETLQDVGSRRRIVIHNKLEERDEKVNLSYMQSVSLARSVSGSFGFDESSPLPFKLMRVWNYIDQYSVGDSIFQLINLRYLKTKYLSISDSVGMLWNIRTLIVSSHDNNFATVPSEIWNLPHLRHMILLGFQLPDIRGGTGNGKNSSTVLENFQTLSCSGGFKCTEEALKRIPKVKTLKISFKYRKFTIESCHLINLCCFEKILSLSLSFGKNYECSQNDFLQHIEFPISLKKLALYSGSIDWEDLSTKIGRLPNLEKLMVWRFVDGEEWNPVENTFLRLKFLEISGCYLVHLNANKSHFPCLEQLILDYMEYLVEIPSGLGEIVTLRNISLKNCRYTCNDSAVTILKQRLRRDGKNNLKVTVDEEVVLIEEKDEDGEEEEDEEEDEDDEEEGSD